MASTCRDLLFHVHETAFTLLEIADILKELQLKFLGFDLRNPDVKNLYVEQFPEDPEGLSLVNWDHFEAVNPETFVGMYQFWVCSVGFSL